MTNLGSTPITASAVGSIVVPSATKQLFKSTTIPKTAVVPTASVSTVPTITASNKKTSSGQKTRRKKATVGPVSPPSGPPKTAKKKATVGPVSPPSGPPKTAKKKASVVKTQKSQSLPFPESKPNPKPNPKPMELDPFTGKPIKRGKTKPTKAVSAVIDPDTGKRIPDTEEQLAIARDHGALKGEYDQPQDQTLLRDISKLPKTYKPRVNLNK